MTERLVLEVLKGRTVFPPPIWLMRQAGRYLPEYRETRRRAGGFLDLCYDADLAAEVTLQPIRRFGFDAAIVFSDILVVPHALGRELRFEEGSGPQMTPLEPGAVEALETGSFHERLEPVYETVRRLRRDLPPQTTLVGFCGAPWTVATYMIAGHGTPDQAPGRLFSHRYPREIGLLLRILADCSAEYLIRQIDAGADAVQIFDSWAGVLDEQSFADLCIAPVKRIVDRVQARHPDVPIIGFPRAVGAYYERYREETGVTALGLDWTVPMEQARRLQRGGPVQGNLDPTRLVVGGEALAVGVSAILEGLGAGPLVFNLGHGIMPETPVGHVEDMIAQIRSATR